jgi:hypothetical protein
LTRVKSVFFQTFPACWESDVAGLILIPSATSVTRQIAH